MLGLSLRDCPLDSALEVGERLVGIVGRVSSPRFVDRRRKDAKRGGSRLRYMTTLSNGVAHGIFVGLRYRGIMWFVLDGSQAGRGVVPWCVPPGRERHAQTSAGCPDLIVLGCVER